MNNQGSIMVLVLLVLFVAILFITAAVYSVVCLNNLQKNENIVIKENISINSLNNLFNTVSMYGGKKANFRGPLNININGESSFGDVSFGYLNSDIRQYLILNASVNDVKGKAPISKKSFKPVPTFTYSHFVMNPNENLGDNRVREECYGVIRANKDNNSFTNITGTAVQDSGKPYVYMQNIDVDDYKELAGSLYIENTSDMVLYFYNDRFVFNNNIYPIIKNSVIAIKNNGYKVVMVGVKDNLYSYIYVNHNITMVCDSPISIESDIMSNFIIISTCKDNILTALSFDINKYIQHDLYPDDVNVNIESIYFGEQYGTTMINVVSLKSIFIATNGSFGFIKNTYSAPLYNQDIVNQFHVFGGIIEYNSNYDMKNFDDVPASQLICERNDVFLLILPKEEFPFIAPPLASNIFCFSSKYF